MSELTIPDEFHDWPFDAKRFVLAEANTAEDLRHRIEDAVGLEHTDIKNGNVNNFTKEELAAIVMALGGPAEPDDD